jgi:hypothetical protein
MLPDHRHFYCTTHPLQPGSCKHRHQLRAEHMENVSKHTFPHGLAMKLGTTPCFIPILLAAYLNKIALSAIFSAEV